MTTGQPEKSRTVRSPRRTFTVREQLLGKLGADKFSALEGRLAARTRQPRKRGGRRP